MTTDAMTAAAAPAAKPPSKSTIVIKLLTRARGATIAEVQSATNWQPHSVRAYLSGLRKAGRTLDKEERKSGETSYRLVAAATAAEPVAGKAASPAGSTAVGTPPAADVTTAADDETGA